MWSNYIIHMSKRCFWVCIGCANDVKLLGNTSKHVSRPLAHYPMVRFTTFYIGFARKKSTWIQGFLLTKKTLLYGTFIYAIEAWEAIINQKYALASHFRSLDTFSSFWKLCSDTPQNRGFRKPIASAFWDAYKWILNTILCVWALRLSPMLYRSSLPRASLSRYWRFYSPSLMSLDFPHPSQNSRNTSYKSLIVEI